jgi:hypothetical protein
VLSPEISVRASPGGTRAQRPGADRRRR